MMMKKQCICNEVVRGMKEKRGRKKKRKSRSEMKLGELQDPAIIKCNDEIESELLLRFSHITHQTPRHRAIFRSFSRAVQVQVMSYSHRES